MNHTLVAVASALSLLAMPAFGKDTAPPARPGALISKGFSYDAVQLKPIASKQVCCLSRESVDSGRRIGPVYRVRNDYCEKGEETVDMKFCKGP